MEELPFMRLDVELSIADSDGEPVPGTARKESILFNEETISMEEVDALVESGMYAYDERVIVATPRQADLFMGKRPGPGGAPVPAATDTNKGGGQPWKSPSSACIS